MKYYCLFVIVSLAGFLTNTTLAEETAKKDAPIDLNFDLMAEDKSVLGPSDLGVYGFEIKAPSGDGRALSIITILYDPQRGITQPQTHEYISFSKPKGDYRNKKILVRDVNFWKEKDSREFVIKTPWSTSRPISAPFGYSISGPCFLPEKDKIHPFSAMTLWNTKDPDERKALAKLIKEHKDEYKHIMTFVACRRAYSVEPEEAGIKYQYSVFARLKPIEEYKGTNMNAIWETARDPSMTGGFSHDYPVVKLPNEIALHLSDFFKEVKGNNRIDKEQAEKLAEAKKRQEEEERRQESLDSSSKFPDWGYWILGIGTALFAFACIIKRTPKRKESESQDS